MNKSTKIITEIPRKMYRIAGIGVSKYRYTVDTSGIEVERTNSPESFIKALEIAGRDIAKGILPRSYRETDRTLPCGASEARVYWSPVNNSISCRFNIDSLNLSEGYAVLIKGEPGLDNKEYIDGLKAVVEERDRINKEIVIPRLLALYDERIKMFKDIALGKVVEVLDDPTNVDGIPLPPGISKSVRGFDINVAGEHKRIPTTAGGSELKRFKEACEIAADLAEKGLYPYSEKSRAPKLPCGTVEKSIAHKSVKGGHQFIVFYNRTKMNKSYRRCFIYTGEVSVNNPNYRDALREAITCRDQYEKSIAESYHNLYLQTAIAILERIREYGQGEVMPKRYIFRSNEYGIKASDKQILGIPFTVGLSLYQKSGIRVCNLSHIDRVRFLDYPHPLYAFKAACEKLLESYRRYGIGRFSRDTSNSEVVLPHGKAEKYISLIENVNTNSLKITVKSIRLDFSYVRSFNYNGVGGVDNPDYMLKLGQAIRARDKAVDKLNELVYSELHSTIRAINSKIETLEENEGVMKMPKKEPLPDKVTFEEGLTDSGMVELNEDLNSSFTEAVECVNANPEAKPVDSLALDMTTTISTNLTDMLATAKAPSHYAMPTTNVFPKITPKELKHQDGPSSSSNVLARIGSDGVIYHIDTNKKAKIEIFDVSTGAKKLVSMNLVDLSVAESHSITGNYNGKEHEIQFTVNGQQLTLHSVNVSEGLEFILTEE